MKNTHSINYRSGQALVTLLVFIVIAAVVTTTAVAILLNTTQSSSIAGNSIIAAQIADSGAENALLRLLRDPDYPGEVLPVGDGSASIVVTGTDPKTIVSTGTVGNFKKTVEVVVTYNDNIMSVSSWNYTY